KTLPNLLVATVRVRQARRLQAGGSTGSHSSFFCAAARTAGPRNRQAGKGTFAFLSAGVDQEFSLQGAASRNDRQTRGRPATGFARRFACARACRPGAGAQIERRSNLRASLGINIIGASALAAQSRI